MKTKLNLALILVTMMFFNSTNSFSTIRNITAFDFSFSPANITVNVGDTIKWTRTGGTHTTTCDGTNGTTRPVGAPAWDAPLTSEFPTFTYVITVAGAYHYVCLPHAPDMAGNITANPSAIQNLSELAESYHLSQNFPNPFNPVTNIRFSIPGASNVVLTIYNIQGQEVQTLINENLSAGTYQADWNAVNFTSGIYYYKLETDNFVTTRKMLLIK